MNKTILIYDASCPFCANLAQKLKINYGIEIIANDSKHLPEFVDRSAVKKDVHFIRRRNKYTAIYSGAEAAVEVIAERHPFVSRLYHLPVIRQLVDMGYFFLKKLRKYL